MGMARGRCIAESSIEQCQGTVKEKQSAQPSTLVFLLFNLVGMINRTSAI
jgi:hypothetical protein